MFYDESHVLIWFALFLFYVIWSAVTINIQRTAYLAAGALAEEETSTTPANAYMKILTPPWQTKNNIIWLCFLPVYVGIIFYLIKFGSALLSIIVTFILISVVRKFLMPSEMSGFWLNKIYKYLKSTHEKEKDTQKAETIQLVLNTFESKLLKNKKEDRHEH